MDAQVQKRKRTVGRANGGKHGRGRHGQTRTTTDNRNVLFSASPCRSVFVRVRPYCEPDTTADLLAPLPYKHPGSPRAGLHHRRRTGLSSFALCCSSIRMKKSAVVPCRGHCIVSHVILRISRPELLPIPLQSRNSSERNSSEFRPSHRPLPRHRKASVMTQSDFLVSRSLHSPHQSAFPKRGHRGSHGKVADPRSACDSRRCGANNSAAAWKSGASEWRAGTGFRPPEIWP